MNCKLMMKRSLMMVGCLACLACSSHRSTKSDLPELVSGKGVYSLRYNPASCLIAQPELDFEIVHEQGTERVYIEASNENNSVFEQLMSLAAQEPEGEWTILGRLEKSVFSYSGGHHARIFSPIEFVEKDPENPEVTE